MIINEKLSYEEFRERFFEIYPCTTDEYWNNKEIKKFVDANHQLRRYFAKEKAYYIKKVAT